MNCDKSVLDEVIKINSDVAISTSRRLAVTDGVFTGISSGAAVAAALQVCIYIADMSTMYMYVYLCKYVRVYMYNIFTLLIVK